MFNHSFTEFRPGSRRLAESIRERMLHLDIVEVTGRINFDELGYNHEGILNIYQYFNQNSTSISMKKIATYKNMSDSPGTHHFYKLHWRIIHYSIRSNKSRLAIRVLNYCKPRINAKRLNDVTATEARGFITCTLSGCYINTYTT